ncbi:hypothetical protein OHA01_26195 [Micromonospora zamorensis]|uniref:hypothetical protein n=1 Tax=Micromonospora zamorensis TaxID=709883 RepID=UPI00386F31AB|nr:hypothetical protein OHA01_26195 [Micromonospora zamorensis]
MTTQNSTEAKHLSKVGVPHLTVCGKVAANVPVTALPYKATCVECVPPATLTLEQLHANLLLAVENVIAADNTDQAIADLRATLNDPTRTSQPSTADPRKPALHSVERTPSPLEHALDEVLTAVNDTDPVGAYDDYDDCSAEELLINRELGRIRQLITEIRVSHNLPVVTR